MDKYIKIGFLGFGSLLAAACAPIEYTMVITEASGLLAQAEEAGAACTEEQLTQLAQDMGTTPASANPEERSEKETSDLPTIVTGENERKTDAVSPSARVDAQDSCHAPFEYYFAREFLNKAREEVGYSDYQAAIEYAQVAKTYANQAYEIATQRRKERGR